MWGGVGGWEQVGERWWVCGGDGGNGGAAAAVAKAHPPRAAISPGPRFDTKFTFVTIRGVVGAFEHDVCGRHGILPKKAIHIRIKILMFTNRIFDS